MPKLTPAQIAGIVKYSGGSTGSSFVDSMKHPDTDGPIFVAIAMAESGGVTDKKGGPNHNGTFDYGLWQINSSHKQLLSEGNWSNPNDNYHMAASLYIAAGYKFTPWSSYTNGKYAAFMGQGASAWGSPDESKADKNAVSDAANATYTGVTSVADLISTLTKAATWVRVGMALGGLILLIIAFEPLLKKTPLGDLAKQATGIAEVAAVA